MRMSDNSTSLAEIMKASQTFSQAAAVALAGQTFEWLHKASPEEIIREAHIPERLGPTAREMLKQHPYLFFATLSADRLTCLIGHVVQTQADRCDERLTEALEFGKQMQAYEDAERGGGDEDPA